MFPCHSFGKNTSAREERGLCPSCFCCRGRGIICSCLLNPSKLHYSAASGLLAVPGLGGWKACNSTTQFSSFSDNCYPYQLLQYVTAHSRPLIARHDDFPNVNTFTQISLQFCHFLQNPLLYAISVFMQMHTLCRMHHFTLSQFS